MNVKRRLPYYEEEEAAYPRQAAHCLKLPYAAALAEELLAMLGLPSARYTLEPRGCNHQACPQYRHIVFRGKATVLDVVHEVAHFATPDHDAHHAATVALLVAMIEARREEDESPGTPGGDVDRAVSIPASASAPLAR